MCCNTALKCSTSCQSFLVNMKVNNESVFISAGSDCRRTCSFHICKFVLYLCCYFWISYSSLKGECGVFSYGGFSSYKNIGQCFSLSIPGIGETAKHLVSIFVAANYAQNRLYYSPLSSNENDRKG